MLWVYVTSASFDPVPEGMMPPEHGPFTYTVIK